MPPPGSTYRLQLHAGFGFDEAAAVAPYLADLGVTHVYCSPYLQAAAGSTHGYDVVDPQHLNEELGGVGGFAHLVGALRAAGLGHVLDIVPNHMAVDPANRWWWDVLENGAASPFSRFFDIDWGGPDDKSAHTVLVPVLGEHAGRVVEAGELALERQGGSVVLRYHDHVLPVSPRTLDEVLAAAARRTGSAELALLAEGFGTLPTALALDAASVRERHERKGVLGAELAALCTAHATIADAVDGELSDLCADPDRLDALLQRQNYRLTHWRTASEEIDYRRFFNIETLIGVRVEDPEVFAETHGLILELVRDGTVDGLRVDHIDGLRDPAGYLDRLADATGGAYTVVEKILAAHEVLPAAWATAGTSGYDFLIRANDLLVDEQAEAALTAVYTSFTGDDISYAEVVHAAKHQVMRDELAAEVDRATSLLADVVDGHRRHRDHTRRDLRDALREVVAAFPVYRTYVRPERPASDAERSHIGAAVTAAKQRRPDIDAELVDFIGAVACGDVDGTGERELAQRLQQLTAPVMAKGVEDTAFYRYHRLISLNEVGGDPGTFGRDVAAFHAATASTAADWPATMLTLSTHDTKRSADVRARLAVLSEMPERWRQVVTRWAERNDRHRQGEWPDRNTEYLLYQTLVGAWPIDVDRVVAFMVKATKEAKVHTSWTDPADDYDAALEAFVRALLTDDGFTAEVGALLLDSDLRGRGRRNSLAQTTLLLTSPGVPDLYQGTELWDLSLVDPDNRRAVDYGERRRLLDATHGATAETVLAQPDSGAPKQWLIQRLLRHRRTRAELYQSSCYEPLAPRGSRAEDVVAFTRGDLVVVVPRRGGDEWGDTSVALPRGSWTDVLTDGGATGTARLRELFAAFPVAVLARAGR